MNIYDLIFMACLQLGQNSECKAEMLKCVLEYRDGSLKEYTQKSDIKKMKPEEYLNSQPQAIWDAWVLDCAQKQEKKAEISEMIKKGVTKK